MIFAFIFSFLSLFAEEPIAIRRYFDQLQILQKSEQWEEIVALGEQALARDHCLKEEEFAICDQLVSSYFRLGIFDKAIEHAQTLVTLGSELNKPELVANSLYKLSAAIRGNSEKPQFDMARKLAYEALELCKEKCPADRALKARVLFNAAAAECDDPNGKNISHAIAMYEEALVLFSETEDEDYRQRTLLRLGKAFLLQGETARCNQIIEEFQFLQPEERTKMHLYYLNAQLLLERNRLEEAKSIAHQGLDIALKLHALADVRRFEQIIALD